VVGGGVVSRASRLWDGRSGLNCGQGQDIFFSETLIPALGPTWLLAKWIPRRGGGGSLFRGVKRPGREVSQSPPFSVEVNNKCSYTFAFPNAIMM